METIKAQYALLLKRLVLLFAVYMIMRLIFYWLNYSYFNLTPGQLVIAFTAGLRFDLVAITITNIIFIALHILPLKVFFSKWYQVVLAFLFFTINAIAIIFNCVDFAYFRFILKRSSADLLNVLSLGEDTENNIGAMAFDFWYVPLLAFVLITLLITLYRKTGVKNRPLQVNFPAWSWFILIPSGLLILLAFRGGAQYKPLRIITAGEYTSPQNAPLILNTTFTIIKTFNKEGLEPVNYFSDNDVEQIFTPVHHYRKAEKFRNLNVVVIILESFGKEYIGYYNNNRGYTPFLDSLIRESLSFRYSFANSKRSIEGLPAVTASFPTLMREPFITSVYYGNKINSLASLLRAKGYQTAFFHGGNNGTMGFDNFTAAAGYEKYYGRKEYGNTDYDGNWGVFDEPFYYYFINKMNEMKQPFHTTFFSLSSHHPYPIPEKFKNVFPKGTMPIHESIGYSDYALKKFFEEAARQSWFDSTLFILTADHTSEAEGAYYKSKLGIYALPVIYYLHNSNLKGELQFVTQQASILPSALDYLNYDLPFIAFGSSVFDTTAMQFAVNYMDDTYQLLADDYCLQFDGEKFTGVYQFKSDSLLQHNLINEHKDVSNYEQMLKGIIQQFNNRLIKNKMAE